MLWWIIPVSFLLLLVGYLLFARFFIGIDSTTGFAGIRFSWLADANVVLNESVQVARVRIGWWKKEFDLFRQKTVERETVEPTDRRKIERKQAGAGRSTRRLVPKIKAVVRSFKINKCSISLDTGDMPLNGILFPWFYLLKWRTGREVSINFVGENKIILEAENTIARMLWAYIKS